MDRLIIVSRYIRSSMNETSLSLLNRLRRSSETE